MHPTDILALIWKQGHTLSTLATEAGVSKQAVSQALRQPVASGERAILKGLGVNGHELWPDRYAKDGARLVRRGSRARRRAA